jgi:phenylacetate-coenzyme A ligase PaaK-like adenylate-forming protein
MIRYRLNDVLTISPEPCPCGSNFRVIKQIQGRSDDMFLGQRIGSQKAQFIFADYIRRAIVSSSDGIREYRGAQISPVEIHLKIELKPKFNTEQEKTQIKSSVTKKIYQVFAKQDCERPEIHFEFIPIHHDFNQKLRRIHRNFAEKDYF